MAINFAERFRQERQGGTRGSNSFATRFSSEVAPMLLESRRRREEQEIEKQNKIREQQQEAINKFKERQDIIQKQLSEGNIIEKARGGLSVFKEFLGYGETLPEMQGGAEEYQQIQQEIQKSKEQKSDWSERLKGVGKSVLSMAKQKNEEYKKSIQERGLIGTRIEQNKGIAKNIGELAAGTGKLALEFSPLTNFSGVRKLTKFVGGKEISEYVDRNTPEYLKKVDAFVDNNGILNYKPKYSNEIQKTGGEVAELGSWFIPITRLGKVAKLEKAIAEIPRIAKVLGATPKIVKVGGNLAYEVSKDVVDVGLLDAIRGKDWEEIKGDMKMAGIGGGAIRTAGLPISKVLSTMKENKIIKSLNDGLNLDNEEKAVVSVMIKQGKNTDDIATEIISKREQAGKDIYEGLENVGEKKVVYSGQSMGGDKKKTTFYTTDKNLANKYAELNKDVTGKSGVVKRTIDDSDFKEVAQNEMFNALENPDIKKNFSGIKFIKKGEIEPNYVFFEDKYRAARKPETFTPKTSLDIETRALEKKLIEEKGGLGELSEVERMKMRKQSIEANDLIKKDYNKAIRIAQGLEDATGNLRPGSVFIAVREKAFKEGDNLTLEKLAKSTIGSEAGQALKAFDAGLRNDPVGWMSDVIKHRKDAIIKKVGNTRIAKESKAIKENITKRVRKNMPTKEDWNKFITEITCT